MSSVRSADAPRLVFATGNAHKVAELEAIIAPLLPEGAGRIARMSDFDVAEPVEDGATFAENSLIKARSLCAATGIAALADDSGLCVDIMGGAPGIFSALTSWGAHRASSLPVGVGLTGTTTRTLSCFLLSSATFRFTYEALHLFLQQH